MLSRALAWNGPVVTLLGLVIALAVGLLLILLSPLGGMLTVGLVVVCAATVIEPLVGLGAALFLGLLQAYLRTWIPQAPAWIAHVFVALTLTVWLARGLIRRDLRIPHPPILLPLVVFLGVALVSLWDAIGLADYGIPELIKWVQILLLYLFVSDYLTRRRLPWLLSILLVTGLFQAAVGVWQFGLRGEGVDPIAVLAGRFYGWKPSAWEQAWVAWIKPFAILGGRFYRAYGTFEQPNAYAGYVGMMLALGVGLIAGAVWDRLVNWHVGRLGRQHPSSQPTDLPIYQPPIYQLLLIGGVTLAMFAALLMSWSRGAWIGFGAAVMVMAFALPRKTRWGVSLVAALVVVGLSLYTIGTRFNVPGLSSAMANVAERLTGFTEYTRFEDVRGVAISPANYAVVERLAHWQAALEMFRHPGVGVNIRIRPAGGGNHQKAVQEIGQVLIRCPARN